MDKLSAQFITALKNHDLETIKLVPKSDLHNHFVLSGHREFLKQKTNLNIIPLTKPLESMDEMHKWVAENLGDHFHTSERRKLMIDAAFYQAKMDGVKILEIGEDVWGLGEYFDYDIEELVNCFKKSHQQFAPDIELRLQIGLSRHCSIPYLERCLEPFWDNDAFYSLDLYGDELSQPIENFKSIYRKAKSKGLKVKAHVGEWGSAEDVRHAVEILELDEVQHGISAVASNDVMDYLRQNHIRLNLTPTSNILLGRTKSYAEHPIGLLVEKGIDVTVNSDDLLIFDSDVSKEYLRLYESGVLSAKDLNLVRLNGLRKMDEHRIVNRDGNV